MLVSAASIEAQLKLLELRRTLEPFAVRLAAQRANGPTHSSVAPRPHSPRRFSAPPHR
ncbi:hypothetical protein MA4S0116R_2185 [Mycobacteroides abscessus 4S-0116-R]|nr:hypothetical protein MA4S0303_4885 [Mycobacteroides abscessus 4S-0303]EIT96620.1 hypothetical protein MA4S0726RA_4820 [Mycobacteroides abscessus 4S-0726-RA]EIV16244.1 hypothetical protein MA4S0206_0012 [Mycobacteroides abscessus 4S-0206]EIV50949.1 hypothetical protein MA4S0116R_2185 [Mycobacteroides abscessus 4S-0116-R]